MYMKIFSKPFVIHFLICITFLALPYWFTIGSLFSVPNLFAQGRDRMVFSSYFLILIFAYLNYYWLLPTFYFQEKYLKYIGIVCLLFILVFGVSRGMNHPFFMGKMPEPPHREHKPHRFPPPGDHVSHTLFLFLTSIFVSMYIRVNARLEQTEQEKISMELSYLKAQINPHFLFNTLNTIYALAIKEDAEQTAKSMLKLSGMMRYVVTESSSDFVPLEKEIQYIYDYIALQKLRLDKCIKLSYSVTGSTNGKQIVPIMLIPFIENAFKHGVNPDEDSQILISIEINESSVYLVVENKKVHTQQKLNEKSGYGIENTQNRLALMYPNKHSLIITENAQHYTIHLRIFLV